MDIAIVGLGCRFPQAKDPLSFWELVRTGGVTFGPIPKSRWDHSTFYDPSLRIPDKAYIDRGAYLDDEDVREFGALHFGIAPRRIQVTDPQHRILLDVVRCALQDAGYEARPWERQRAGVFIGASANEHKEILLARLRAMQMFDGSFGRQVAPGAETLREALVEQVVPIRAFSIAGNLLNMSAATVAQQFDLGGPAIAIDAACSSALVATQQAIVNLRAKQIDLAIAGGIYVNLLPDNLVGFSRVGAISRSGECRPFDARADGFVMGEGVGAVILKRREDAERDGDRIYALIRGAGCNNDGRSEGPMTPRPGGQLEALRLAYADAGFSPRTVGYVEAHGTATTVGDVVEVSALRTLFDEDGWTAKDGAHTALGSVKANIGHTMSAAGIAGLIKAALALHHRALPPQPSVQEENPKLGLADGPFFLPRAETPWESNGQPRRAGVSSFGFGGTNAHVVLEEAPAQRRRAARAPAPLGAAAIAAAAPRRAELFLLAGSSAAVVAKFARQLAAALPQLERSRTRLADVAFTLSQRAHGEVRLALVAESYAQLGERLSACAAALVREPVPAQPVPGASFSSGKVPGKIALLFPGQGAQRVGLLREAYEQLPAFRARLDALDDSLGAELHAALGGTLRSFLHAAPSPEAEERLKATQVCQPAMAAVGLALHAVLARTGVHAELLLGHSLGEFVAAAAAGIITAEECVRLVARRGLAMEALQLPDPGTMASAAADAGTVAAAIAGLEGVVVANVNHPLQTVVSGTAAGVAAASRALAARSVKVTPLEVSHAFHSPLMAGVAQAIGPLVAALEPQQAQPTVVSAITGAPYPADPRPIWLEHATAPVDFAKALRSAAALHARIFVQVGAGNVLGAMAKATLSERERAATISLASRDEDGLAALGLGLGQLWALGATLDFGVLYEGRDAQLATLPPTPIETQPYWAVEPAAPGLLPLELGAAPQGPVEKMQQLEQQDRSLPGESMDPLVSLFREQVALLQQQAKVLEQQAQALAARGVAVPGAAALQGPASVPSSSGSNGGATATRTATPAAIPTVTPTASSTAIPTAAAAASPTGTATPNAPSLSGAAPPATVANTRLPGAPFSPDAASAEASRAILSFVSRISAFPVESLKASQTLVGDLGFDSLMTVELDADIAKAFPSVGGIPRSLLGPQTSVQDLIDHLAGALAAPPAPPSPVAPSLSAALGVLADAGPELLRFSPALIEVPLPRAAPSEQLLPHTLLLTRDEGGVAEALAKRLRDLGHEVILGDGAAQPVPEGAAVIHLGSLGRDPGLDAISPEIISAHRLARARVGAFVVASSGGGMLSAALAGFAKALSREREGELIKSVDLDLSQGAQAAADALLAELQSGNTAPEVVWRGGARSEPELKAASDGEQLSFEPSDVVLISGGTRGVGAKLAAAVARSGCGVIVVGRRSPEGTLPERTVFVRWDITQPAGAALDEARAALGGITAIVHAAGVSEDAAVSAKDDASVARVVAPKLLGLKHLLDATARDPLRAAVFVSSWAGRFGNAGQADYSAANAALSRAAALLPGWRKGLKATALEYPPWDGTAMVARIPAYARGMLAEQGVPFIDDASGEGAFLAALQAGATGEILLAYERPARRTTHRSRAHLTRKNHLFLDDHQLAGQPVLPLASALDLVANAAFEATAPGAILVRDFKLLQPVRIAESADLTLLVSGEAKPQGELLVKLLNGRAAAYTAFATTGADIANALASAPPAPPAQSPAALPLSLEEFYSSTTFHGPRLQGILEIEQITPQGIVGLVRTSRPADWIERPRRGEWAIDPLALDGAFQLAGYWVWTQHQRAGFPIGIEEFVQLEPLGEGPVRASLSLEQASGDVVRGTIVLQGSDGRVLAVARGVEGEFKHRDPRFLTGRSSRTAPPAAAPLAAVAPLPPADSFKAPNVDQAFYKFDQFPEVQELEQRLGLAAAFGLKNPYFNVHERVTNDTSVIGGRTMINWSSYNYLGLSGDPHVSRAAQEAIERYGTSVSASRVASGEKPLHRELETELARFLGTEDSIVMVSGHGVFVTTIGHLVGDGDLILHDSLAHDCILGGAKLSGAKRRPFPHNDFRALDRQLAQLRPHFKRVLIAVEGVYSMDGDIAALPEFIALKKKYGALLLVDEAHSVGVLGETGRGVGEHYGVNRADVDLWMGTMSKSLASCGGYVAGSKTLVQYLKYTAPGFIYSVGITPANAAAGLEALRQLEAHPEKVRRLHERSALFLKLAKEKGIDTGFASGSAVVPAILGNSLHSLQVSEALRQRGINVQPILYPAVEETAARLRFFCTATHTEQQIRESVHALAEEIERVRSSDLQTGSV